MADRSVDVQLDAIEEHLSRIEATVRLLVASRLITDGHAPDWNTAVAMARDLDRLRRLYPEAFRE